MSDGPLHQATMLAWVEERTGGTNARVVARVASLWSGYGEVVRVALDAASVESVVVKDVRPPAQATHPRGWHGARGQARKLRSYAVEQHFYRHFANRSRARLPRCLGAREAEGRWLLALEDLDAAGFAGRRNDASPAEVDRCLRWLAAFHATFLGVAPEGLWDEGTYWHLATRPEELDAMAGGPLKDAATELDARLRAVRFRTFVHGDAKLANFCFAQDAVAAVDFQYVGGGCGVKDLAYLLSCLDAGQREARGAFYVDSYFAHLRHALKGLGRAHEAPAIEAEWRALYAIAWADFSRFLAGWAPQHRKRDRHAARMTEQALRMLRGSSPSGRPPRG